MGDEVDGVMTGVTVMDGVDGIIVVTSLFLYLFPLSPSFRLFLLFPPYFFSPPCETDKVLTLIRHFVPLQGNSDLLHLDIHVDVLLAVYLRLLLFDHNVPVQIRLH